MAKFITLTTKDGLITINTERIVYVQSTAHCTDGAEKYYNAVVSLDRFDEWTTAHCYEKLYVKESFEAINEVLRSIGCR